MRSPENVVPFDVCPKCNLQHKIPEGWDVFSRFPCVHCDPEAQAKIDKILLGVVHSPVMECGHTANATQDGKPVCVICIGITCDAARPRGEAPNLTGRTSVCPDCRKTQISRTDLPFFHYRPDRTEDSHYCGCRGWN